MSVIIFIIGLSAVLIFLWATLSYGEVEGAAFFFICFLLSTTLFFALPYYSLNSDVHTVLTEREYIEMEQEYISDLRGQLDSFPEFDAALLNADTPVATITTNLHDAQKTLRERKVKILDAKREIRERENGLTSYIFWFYSDELLKQANKD